MPKRGQRPTSWNSSEEERERLRRIQGQLLVQGARVNQSQVLTLGLYALEKMSEKELIELFNKKQEEEGSE